MKNRFFILIFLLLFFVTLSHGQQWDSVVSWMCPGGGGHVSFLKVINNELYISGPFTPQCGAPASQIAKFDGTTWYSIGADNIYPFGEAEDIEIYNGQVFIGGNFNCYYIYGTGCISNTQNLAMFDGTVWGPVSDSTPQKSSPNAPVLSLQSGQILLSFNKELYIGGQTGMSSVGGISCNHIASWDGTNWDNVGGGVSGGFWPEVRAMAVYKGELYAGGAFDWYGGNPNNAVKNIARWNGNYWSTVENGLPSAAAIYSMVVDTSSNILYIAGAFATNGVSQVVVWNGDSLHFLPPVIPQVSSNGIALYRNKLFIAGSSSYGRTIVNSWDGIKWNEVEGPNNTAITLAVYNDWLYAGGYFDSVMTANGPMEVNYIARYYEPPCYGMAAEISMAEDTVYLSDSALVQFYDSSAGLHKSGWQWYFGGPDTSHQQNPAYFFTAPGFYPVMLVVNYPPPDNCSSTAYDVVTVLDDCASIEANFSSSADTAIIDSAGQAEIQFNDSSINAKYVKWYFGDGATSNDSNPAHTYDSVGIYDVLLVVNKGLCYDTAYMPVVIMDVGMEEEGRTAVRPFKIYPNPNGGSFTIEILACRDAPRGVLVGTGQYRAEVYDAKGHLVRAFTIKNQKSKITRLEGGVYFVKIMSEGKTIGVERVVVV